jgi:hypothetical protein
MTRREADSMDTHDAKFKKLLMAWKDVECRPTFHDDVLRRIRSITPERTWGTVMRTFVEEQLAAATTTAVLAGAILGLLISLTASPLQNPHELRAFGFMGANTLSGSFIQLAKD